MQTVRNRRHGLIPAHAGKTRFIVRGGHLCWAHPRSRGENGVTPAVCASGVGSSPLTRGKRQLLYPRSLFQGLIPAHAGKTAWPGPSSSCSWAHPRSRGENAAEETAVDIHLGSSPLTRGKRQGLGVRRANRGLIPAHAGKTCRCRRASRRRRAHPRSRGENGVVALAFGALAGSSPLTRGKLVRDVLDCGGFGLIPAHAGKTCDAWRRVRQGRAHPRSRGENSSVSPSPETVPGSSPLTRGKPASVPDGCAEHGLIPAHAGKTRRRFRRSYVMGAHPRSRGENGGLLGAGLQAAGSSPLTRGKR